MKIRTKLIVIATTPVVLLLVLTTFFLTAANRVERVNNKAIAAQDLTNQLDTLAILTYEHHIYFEERARSQWLDKYEAIGKILQEQGTHFAEANEKEIVDRLGRNYRNLGFLFEQYGPHTPQTRAQPPSDQVKSFRNRITARLLQELAVISPGALKLHELNHDRALALSAQVDEASMVVVALLAVILLTGAYLVIRAFSVPVKLLNEACAKVSAGDLSCRVRNQSSDELGILSRAFDGMAERLQANDGALRRLNFDLEAAVGERTQELSEANEELTRTLASRLKAEQALKLNEERLAALLDLSQRRFESEEGLLRHGLEEAVRLTRSKVGYLHLFNEESQTLGLFLWSQAVLDFCTAVKTPHYPLEEAGVWADCVRLRQPVIHNDYQHLPTKNGVPEGHFPLARHLSLPLFEGERIVAVIGVGNKEETYDDDDVRQLTLYMASTWGIVKRKRAETLLSEAQAETLFKGKLLDAASDSIFLVDPEGKIVMVNEAAYRTRGYLREEMIGMSVAALDLPEYASQLGSRIQQIFTVGGSVFESAHRCKDGSILPVEVHAQSLEVKGKRLILSSVRDISERKHGEDVLRKYALSLERSNKELEHFAYVASHDLQEPLRKIGSFTELLARKYQDKLDDKAGAYINYIVDGAHRMQILINDLLSFSRVTTKGREFAAVDCNALLARVQQDVEFAMKERSASLSVTELPTVMADEVQLGQVFQNLITNALKYCAADRRPEIRLLAQKRGAEWVFAVSDNGIGIEPQHFERIFQLFQRLHTREEYSGTGIGLALCKKIIERHGGNIWVESAPDKGSTFYFTIPLAQGKSGDRQIS